jgi:hypothetical protein
MPEASLENYLIKNVARNGRFTKNNCAAGATGFTVTYSVAARAYSSIISQADADSRGRKHSM